MQRLRFLPKEGLTFNEHSAMLGEVMNEMNEIKRIVNRHKARLLTSLEDVHCPDVFLQAVRSGIDWMRSDLQAMDTTEGNEHDNTEASFNR